MSADNANLIAPTRDGRWGVWFNYSVPGGIDTSKVDPDVVVDSEQEATDIEFADPGYTEYGCARGTTYPHIEEQF